MFHFVSLNFTGQTHSKKVRLGAMLNTANEASFFENCLVETGLVDGRFQRITLAEVRASAERQTALKRALRDIQTGADAVLARGKPAEDTLGLSLQEWEYRWSAWVASRKAAFYSRAALFLLGEAEFLPFFLNTLKTSHNIVFICATSDLLQHASGYILNGPEEDLPAARLADWWEQNFALGKVTLQPAARMQTGASSYYAGH